MKREIAKENEMQQKLQSKHLIEQWIQLLGMHMVHSCFERKKISQMIIEFAITFYMPAVIWILWLIIRDSVCLFKIVYKTFHKTDEKMDVRNFLSIVNNFLTENNGCIGFSTVIFICFAIAMMGWSK